MRKALLNSPRFKKIQKEKTKKIQKKILVSFVLGVIIFIGLCFLSNWSELNIQKVEISGNKIIDGVMLKEAVEKKLTGKYLWLFPKTNFILYPQRGIEKELKNKFKRIAEVKVNDLNVNTLTIEISERKPLYTWCGLEPSEVAIKSGCYFMDENGFIFDEAPYFSEEVYFKFYGKANLETEIIGAYFVPDFWSALLTFKEAVKKMGLEPVAFYLNDKEEAYLLLQLQNAEQNPTIIFKLDSDMNKITENLQSVLDTEPLLSDLRTKYNSLLYIDLRFGNKVYYKFK